MKVHLDLACVKLRKTEDKLETLQKRLEGKTFSTVMARNESPLYPFKYVWKVSGFSDKMRQAKAGEQRKLESDPFYTEDYGNRLKLRIYPYGRKSARSSHLSVFIVVLKGEYDAILPWPFKRKMRFTLIDQQEDPEKQKNVSKVIFSSHIENYGRPEKEENLGRGFRNFLSHEELYSRGYVQNDMLFLQFEVGPGIRPVKKIISSNSSSEKDEITSRSSSSERDTITSGSSSESDTSDS
ncbi:TNF receptor-associated factor 4-like [Stylophora pistillata]|uniref:TNF receptor-associated factor 4-like n=1 Tax=Stylophora pistillata TaxID=50429 RepID=UPI000C057598|nr:TNF receptor-associated factor 4-like [Stylophora pistillata]